jgi:hypothetical protein
MLSRQSYKRRFAAPRTLAATVPNDGGSRIQCDGFVYLFNHTVHWHSGALVICHPSSSHLESGTACDEDSNGSSGGVHTTPRGWPDSADAVGTEDSRVAVQAMLEKRLLLVRYPFQRGDGPMAAHGTSSGSKYKSGLHHLWCAKMRRLAPREVAD